MERAAGSGPIAILAVVPTSKLTAPVWGNQPLSSTQFLISCQSHSAPRVPISNSGSVPFATTTASTPGRPSLPATLMVVPDPIFRKSAWPKTWSPIQ